MPDGPRGPEADSPGERRPPPQVAGELRFLPPFELLPILADLGKFGSLRLVRSDGLTAECRVERGAIASAAAGHLAGREAILTFLWWNEGRFEFEAGNAEAAGEAGEVGEGIHVPEILMDAVRLADETERRKEAIPPREQRLALAPDAGLDPDEYDCGLPLVFEALRQQAGLSCAELERRLPLAPMKVRLGVALLAAANKLRGFRVEYSGIFRRTAVTWWHNVLLRYPGGIRVLVASCRTVGREQIEDAVALVATSLHASGPTSTYASDGPSFVRMRPADGGILSLTFLPTGKKHRYLFETFVRSIDAVLLCSDDCPCGEKHDWGSAVPKGVRVITMAEPSARHRDLGRALRALGETGTTG